MATELVQVHNVSSAPSIAPAASSTRLAGNGDPSNHTGKGQPNLERRDKIVIGVAVPLPLVTLAILGVFVWRNIQRRRLVAAAAVSVVEKDSAKTEDGQPFLQRKAELEAVERRKHELEARQALSEVTGEDAVFEMPTGKETRMITTLQELRGAEHSSELEVAGNL